MNTKTIVSFLRNCGLQHDENKCIPPTCEECIEGIFYNANPTKEQQEIQKTIDTELEKACKVIERAHNGKCLADGSEKSLLGVPKCPLGKDVCVDECEYFRRK